MTPTIDIWVVEFTYPNRSSGLVVFDSQTEAEVYMRSRAVKAWLHLYPLTVMLHYSLFAEPTPIEELPL